MADLEIFILSYLIKCEKKNINSSSFFVKHLLKKMIPHLYCNRHYISISIKL